MRSWPDGANVANQGSDRRARIAAQRASAQRTRTRNRLLIAGGAIVAVVGIVLGLVLAGGNSTTSGGGSSPSAAPGSQALASLITTTTSVPTATLNKIGGGTTTSPPKTISGAPLTSGGKPEVLYIGAEYCPYCAAERWSMVVALSRFGTDGYREHSRAQRDLANAKLAFEPAAGTRVTLTQPRDSICQ